MHYIIISVCCCLCLVLCWTIGVISGILAFWVDGARNEFIKDDPAKNGTSSIYTMILVFQFTLAVSSIFGVMVCIKMMNSSFRVDRKLKYCCFVWFTSWSSTLFGILTIGMYGFARGKHPEGQLGFMLEIFQINSQRQQFIKSFETYQEQNNCCGIYGSNDWLVVQLNKAQSQPVIVSPDYPPEPGDARMSPATGNCPGNSAVLSEGCGPRLIFEINTDVILYCGLIMGQLILGIATGILAWIAFINWVKEGDIPIPSKSIAEISDIVIVDSPQDGYGDNNNFQVEEIGRSKISIMRLNKMPSKYRRSEPLQRPPGLQDDATDPAYAGTESTGEDESNGESSSKSHTATKSSHHPSRNENETIIHVGYLTKSQLESKTPNLTDGWRISRLQTHPTSQIINAKDDDNDEFPGLVDPVSVLVHKHGHGSKMQSHGGGPSHNSRSSRGFLVSDSDEFHHHNHRHFGSSSERHPHHHDYGSSYYGSSQGSNPVESLYRAGSRFNDSSFYSGPEIPSTSYNSNYSRSSRPAGPQPTKAEIREHAMINQEEKAILKDVLHGGKVVGEIKIEHKFDRDGNPIKGGYDRKLATLTIVRNKHVHDPPPPPPGLHGQTGHLAEDIADMSGLTAKKKIKINDLIMPGSGAKEEPVEPGRKSKKVFGSVTGVNAQQDLEDLISPSHLRKQVRDETEARQKAKELIKPHYLVVSHPHNDEPAFDGHRHSYHGRLVEHGLRHHGSYDGEGRGRGSSEHAMHYLGHGNDYGHHQESSPRSRDHGHGRSKQNGHVHYSDDRSRVGPSDAGGRRRRNYDDDEDDDDLESNSSHSETRGKSRRSRGRSRGSTTHRGRDRNSADRRYKNEDDDDDDDDDEDSESVVPNRSTSRSNYDNHSSSQRRSQEEDYDNDDDEEQSEVDTSHHNHGRRPRTTSARSRKTKPHKKSR